MSRNWRNAGFPSLPFSIRKCGSAAWKFTQFETLSLMFLAMYDGQRFATRSFSAASSDTHLARNRR